MSMASLILRNDTKSLVSVRLPTLSFHILDISFNAKNSSAKMSWISSHSTKASNDNLPVREKS